MALRTPDKADDKLNPGQADYSRKFDGIAKQEEAGTFDDIAKNYGQTADPSQENANISKAQALENNPTGDWKTKIGDAKDIALAASGNAPTSASKSPLVVILIIIFGGGFSFAGLFGAFSLLPIDVVSQFFNKEDAQSTSFNIRADKIINTKISKATTSRFCTSNPDVSLLCRYERPSNKLLNALDKEGVKAVGKSGDVIEGKRLFPNERPVSYTFKGEPIKASEFSSRLASDPELRAAFHNAYTPRFVSWADSVFKAIKTRFGFTTSDKNAEAKTTEDVTNNLDENSKGPETGAKAAAEGVGDSVDTVVEDVIEKPVTKEIQTVAESGKGNLVGLVSGVVCGIGDIPGLIIKVVRAYQMIQLVDYAVTYVTSVEAWKANQATPSEVNALGSLLTTVVDGKSAMDSFGMKNVLFGDTKTTDTSYKTYSPGESAIVNLGGLNQITSGPVKGATCGVLTNPATGVAIDVATADTGVGAVIAIGNALLGYIGSSALSAIAPPLVKQAIALIPEDVKKNLLSFFIGDLTQNLLGQNVGNALTSGLVHLMGQTANRGGNMALTIKQKIAYNQATDQVNLAYAEEDRATHSPLDASNPNTFLGSLVGNLLPYYSDMGSLNGFVSSLGSIVTGSLGSIFRQASASAVADDGSEYTLCDDPAISQPSDGSDPLAAGPFCDIQYGIPTQYLDKDPEQVASNLIASGDIDPTTGDVIEQSNPIGDATGTTNAKGSYYGWLQLCGDGTTDNASNCALTDANVGNYDPNKTSVVDYALYTIDHRVQTTMDGEDPVLDPTTNSSDSSSSSTTTDSSTTDNSTDSTTTDSSSTPAATTDTSTTSSTNTASGSDTTTTTDTTTSPATDTTPPASDTSSSANTSGFVPVTDNSAGYALNLSNLFSVALPPKKLQGITV